jgi:hypothetical protein
MDDITNQPTPTPPHITDQAAPMPHPALPAALNDRVKTDVLGYVLIVMGVAVVTVLMAIIGGPPLVGVVGVITVLAIVHYWTWGRSLGHKLADEQARRFREQPDVDPARLSEIERPRHY